MAQSYKFISLALAVLVGIFIQVLLVFADGQDSPNKAALEFTTAYFAMDKGGMTARFCEDGQVVDDVDIIDQYVYVAVQDAHSRGFDVDCYTRNRLYHAQTVATLEGNDKATVRLTAEVKSPLRTFFSGTDIRHIDETLTLVQKDGMWKVCGQPFSL